MMHRGQNATSPTVSFDRAYAIITDIRLAKQVRQIALIINHSRCAGARRKFVNRARGCDCNFCVLFFHQGARPKVILYQFTAGIGGCSGSSAWAADSWPTRSVLYTESRERKAAHDGMATPPRDAGQYQGLAAFTLVLERTYASDGSATGLAF